MPRQSAAAMNRLDLSHVTCWGYSGHGSLGVAMPHMLRSGLIGYLCRCSRGRGRDAGGDGGRQRRIRLRYQEGGGQRLQGLRHAQRLHRHRLPGQRTPHRHHQLPRHREEYRVHGHLPRWQGGPGRGGARHRLQAEFGPGRAAGGQGPAGHGPYARRVRAGQAHQCRHRRLPGCRRRCREGQAAHRPGAHPAPEGPEPRSIRPSPPAWCRA